MELESQYGTRDRIKINEEATKSKERGKGTDSKISSENTYEARLGSLNRTPGIHAKSIFLVPSRASSDIFYATFKSDRPFNSICHAVVYHRMW